MRIIITSIISFILVNTVAFADVDSNQLRGRWLRTNPTGIGDPQEGFVLSANGTGSFIGIHSMQLAYWKVANGKLIVATKTERYPKPNEESYTVTLTRDGLLILKSSKGDYLNGTYHRHAKQLNRNASQSKAGIDQLSRMKERRGEPLLNSSS